MSKKFKGAAFSVLSAVFCMILCAVMVFSACATTSNKAFNNTYNNDNIKSPAAAASSADSNSLRYIVSSDFEQAWNNAVKVSKAKNKQVYFVLNSDWIAPTTPANHPFGADADGFSYGRITVPSGADIVLDLNGHTIDRGLTAYTQLGSVLNVVGNFTLEDGVGGGTVTGGFTGEYNNWHPVLPDEDYGGGVSVNGGTFTLNGGTITGNYSDCGGGVCVMTGKFVMNGGTITNNGADRVGGGVEIDSTNVEHIINGGEISHNTCAGPTDVDGGGGLSLWMSVKLTMNGGKITHNSTTADGGGVLVYNNAEIVFNDGEISYNDAGGNEGAISMAVPSSVELNGGIITQNTQVKSAAIAPSANASNSVKVGGPVKIYNNYNTGTTNQNNLQISAANQLKITDQLVTERGSAFIGITTTLSSGKVLTSGLKSNGKVFDVISDLATWFFSDSTSKRIISNSTKTEAIISNGATTYFDLDWQYQLNNSGTWVSATDKDLNLTYGDKVTAVRTLTEDTAQTAADWNDGGTNTTNPYLRYNDDNGSSATAFTSIGNVGKYSFLLDSGDAFWTAYWAAHGDPHAVLMPATFTVNVKPKDIKVNISDKNSEYGTAIKDLYDGATIDPSTPLVGTDASIALKDLVTLTTEATNTSDLGTYNIEGAVKSTNAVNKNYNYTFKTASYTIGQATVTAKLSGSNTYNGSAQNSATLTFTYPTGFAGTKMTTSDYTLTYPTNGCVNVGKYDKDDISLALGTTTNASRFKLADTDPLTGEYEIKKAKLTCTADDKSVGVGDAAPAYTVTYTGFVGTDTAATVVKGTLTFTCSYTTTSASGTYDITPAGTTADNYEIEFKKGKLTVGTGSVAKPSITTADLTYDGSEQVFTVTGYNSTAITSVTLSDTTNFTWDAPNAQIKATKAGKCKVTFSLDTTKYKWSDNTLLPHEINIEMKPMPLVFSFTPTGDTNWKWDHGATGAIAYSQTATLPATDTLAYYFSYYPTATPASAVKVTGTSLDVSTLNAGNYTAEVRLVASGEAGYSADNANYTIDSNSKNTQTFKIDAGGADVSVLVWKYVKGSDPAADLFQTNGTQTDIRYEVKDGNAVVYTIPVPEIPAAHNYLTIDATKFTNGVKTEKDGVPVTNCTEPGTYTTTVALKTTSNYLFDNPTEVDNISADKLSGEVSITWTIGKAKVDMSKVVIQYGWEDDNGDTDWKDFDEKNLPVFDPNNDVKIRIKPESYPDGITNAETMTYTGDRDKPGSPKAIIKYTLDPKYVYVKEGTTNEVTGSFTETVSVELSKKKITVDKDKWIVVNVKDSSGNDVLDDNGAPYQVFVLDFGSDPDNLKQYVKYEYYLADPSDPTNPALATPVTPTASGTTDNAQLDYLIDVEGAGKKVGSTTKVVPIFVKVVIDTSVAGSGDYVLDVPVGTADDYKFTELGEKKTLIEVDQLKTELVYGTALTEAELLKLTKDGAAFTAYKAKIYAGTDDTNAVDLATFDFAQANAGTYTVALTLNNSSKFILNKSSLTLVITQKPIEVPHIVGNIEFNGETLKLENFLDGNYKDYFDKGIISAIGGRADARNVSANAYVATITIVNPNYKWQVTTAPAPAKSLARAVLTDGEVTSDITLNADESIASYSWNVAPFKLTTDIVNTSGKDGASINVGKLPEWARNLITDGSLSAGVKYYVDENCTEEVAKDDNGNYILAKKTQYYVKPFIGAGENGDDSGNFTFATDGTVTNTSAKAVTYKLPQTGMAAFAGNIKGFVTKTWLGLPIWAWIAIGVALLILLIIIIAVAVHRRKTKAIREEKKAAKQAAKEEAEAKAEAERARLESQRELEKMKAEAEAAKAKAQAEAEIAKIRAQAQAQMPQMPAMPQQPQMPQQMPQQFHQPMPQYQQPMPQPQQQFAQQSMPQQSVDGGVLARLEAEIAAMRAEHRTEREFAAMRAEQRADRELNAMKTELEISKLRADQRAYAPAQQPAQQPFESGLSSPDMQMIGTLAVAIWKSMKEGANLNLAQLAAQPAEQLPAPQTVKEEVSQPVSTAYPPDAVITTTTTVDTTKGAKVNLRSRDAERDQVPGFADIDGFYDSYEG